MRAGLGDNAEYHQPRPLREQKNLGSLKMKQTGGQALPVQQHDEYQLAVTTVKEREQQRIAGEKPRAERTASTPISFIVVATGWLVDEFRGGINRGNG